MIASHKPKQPVIDHAIIYCRVSSVKQTVEGTGLSSQETRCRQHAQFLNLDVVKVFSDDMTGSVIDRPGIKDLVKFLKANKHTKYAVIIDDISRLARGVVQHHMLRDMIKKAGGILTSPSLDFADDSDSLFRENLMASLAQHMRQKNGEQTRNRMYSRAIAGYWPFRSPIGYKMVRKGDSGKMLVPDEPLASAIREIYEGYAIGRFGSLSEIVRFLEVNPTWPKNRAEKLTVERVTELLTRPHYAGYINAPEWGIHMVQGKHEALISFATYQRVQERLTQKAKNPARVDINEDFPLRGFVRCDCCGNYMTSCWSKGRNGKYPYYICQTRGCSNKGKSVRKEKMEAEFEAILKSMRPSVELFTLATEMFKDLWDEKQKSKLADKRAFEAEIDKTNMQIATIVDRLVESDSQILINAYEKRIKELEIHRAETQDKIANCGRPVIGFDTMYRTAIGFLSDPYKLWENNDLASRRAVLKLAFAEDLVYSRDRSYRTATLALPFKFFNDLQPVEGENHMGKVMVRMAGLEPARALQPNGF